jgi:hypothetical protein
MIAARFRPGAISESSSSHLPPGEGSKRAKPVMFPPGRSSRATRPLATGSPTIATIGIVRVSRWRATVAGVPPVRITRADCTPLGSAHFMRPFLRFESASRGTQREGGNASWRGAWAVDFFRLGEELCGRKMCQFRCACRVRERAAGCHPPLQGLSDSHDSELSFWFNWLPK